MLDRRDPPAPAPKRGDALGALLADYLAAPSQRAAISGTLEFDTGDQYESPAHTYFADRSTWTPVDEWLMSRAIGHTLDIGVGAGRFSLEAKSNPSVSTLLGIDVSPGAVAIARSRGLHAAVGRFPDNMPENTKSSSWQTIMMMGNNLGLLRHREPMADGLSLLRELVVPSGVLIGSSGLPHHLPPKVQQAGMDRWGRRGAFTARLIYRDLATPWFHYEFFEPPDLLDRARAHRWEVEEFRRTDRQWGVVLRPPSLRE